ncbi:MAG: hypothetical protein K2Y29_13080 [Beijerinckiaceae bacterium]|nr:hypothetical protein [Beijerinckiaceae bacterium]
MRLPSCLVVAGLALSGCSQTGQNDMTASFAPLGGEPVQGSAIGLAEAPQASPAASGGGFALASFFAPPQQMQAQAETPELIPGDFVAPENPPLPPPRPLFGDRAPTALAEAPAPTAAPAATAFAPSAPALMNTPPAIAAPQTAQRAEAASLGAYEFKTAGVPLPAGGLKAEAVSFAPANFEIAGAPATGANAGGQTWRAAYDTVETDCFPQELRRALDKIAAHFKSDVLVTSGMRERGRRGSLHRSCKAADIRVVGVSPSEVARVARNIPGVNGVGTYRRVAVTHVDVREERFAWRW